MQQAKISHGRGRRHSGGRASSVQTPVARARVIGALASAPRLGTPLAQEPPWQPSLDWIYITEARAHYDWVPGMRAAGSGFVVCTSLARAFCSTRRHSNRCQKSSSASARQPSPLYEVFSATFRSSSSSGTLITPSDVLVELQGSEDTLVIGRCAPARQDYSPFRLGAVAESSAQVGRSGDCRSPQPGARGCRAHCARNLVRRSGRFEALGSHVTYLSAQARPLLVAHAIETPDAGRWAANSGHAKAVLDTYASARVLAARKCLDGWAKAQGLREDQVYLLDGVAGPTEQLVAFAEHHDAAVLVTTPHSRSYVQQLVGTSFSGELAGYARCPVAVV